MNRHSFRSPLVVTLETAPGHKSQYLIRDLYKAMAVMRWYKLKPLRDLRGLSPGIWLVTASAMARAHEHSDPGTIEHAQDMFAALQKRLVFSPACKLQMGIGGRQRPVQVCDWGHDAVVCHEHPGTFHERH